MTALQDFCELVRCRNDAALPLLAAAAQVPLYAEPDCQPRAVLEQVSTWSAQLRARVAADASSRNRLRLLNHFFFGELRFAGATGDYYSAQSSYLHRVIERRRGIPIALSLIYVALGQAIGLRLAGVSFPGHFLVKLPFSDGSLLIDVYAGGVSLSSAQLRARLRATVPGSDAAPLAPYLRAATEREILARLLRNLKAIHFQANDWPAALEVMNRLVAVLPEVAQERRDRARVFEKLDCPRAAVADLVAYLSLEPSPPDARDVRRQLAGLQQAAARLN